MNALRRAWDRLDNHFYPSEIFWAVAQLVALALILSGAFDSAHAQLFNTHTSTRTRTPVHTKTNTRTRTPTMTISATFTPSATNTSTPTESATFTFTATPSATNTWTPTATRTATPTATESATFTLTLSPVDTVSPEPWAISSRPVSSIVAQAMVTPPIGYSIEVHRMSWLPGTASNPRLEFFGGPGTIIGDPNCYPVDFSIGNESRFVYGGDRGAYPILPIDQPLYVREATPVAQVTIGAGVTYPMIVVQGKFIFKGSQTATSTRTATPTATP